MSEIHILCIVFIDRCWWYSDRHSFGCWGQVGVTLLYRWTDWYTNWYGLS